MAAAGGDAGPGAPRVTGWPDLLGALVQGRDQSRASTAWAMEQILGGAATPAQIAAFVVALRAKGETVEEIAGLADTMLDFATPVEIGGAAVDVVGSGGDRSNTVNISTMAALVAAGAGARVVKHGNRAASSACGSADVLEALGVALDLPPEAQQEVADRAGIVFLFAPHYHPALRHAGPVRRELGIPTTFNYLGPLTNPAQPGAQAVGVADGRMAALVAGVFAARGHQGLVVHGGDGLDELTTTTSSRVWVHTGGAVTETALDPRDLGLPRADPDDLTGGDPAHNAQVVRDVLAGRPGPVHDVVVLNAAATLVAFAGPEPERLTEQLAEQLAVAEDAIASGRAAETLDRWVDVTRALALS
ncbi:anthranilate phosphoribosyltransferase [Microlunatus capsulatus]|uniref:Anthranilate phosphoribosyltransferase n=1 Tax=Microlunatus capsulatus TaxID=99117 RepID=A0ABS4ZB94_9ACTN|nr:anthranilate phosphoribosyltransferase [Microlunatus capsulatus]MBP2418329.1 anthranilate phosphoribosyltransferase [Microlunatus capsulatus]